MNNKFWLLILLPIIGIAILAIALPKSGNSDWDDDDDEGYPGHRNERVEDSAIDNFTEEEIRNWPVAPDPEWGGNSPEFRKEVAPGIVISARKNAFERPTDVKFRFATEEEHQKASEAVKLQLQYHTPLFSFDLDAGLGPMERIPGTFNVELDLDKLGIPENVRDGLTVCRIDDYGNVQEWNCRLDGSKISFDSDRNSLWLLGFSGIALLASALGAGAITVGAIAIGGLGPLLNSYGSVEKAFWNKPFVYHYFQVEHYGTVSIGFNPEDSEHPNPGKYIQMVNEVEVRLSEHKRMAELQRDYERELRDYSNPVPIYFGGELSSAEIFAQNVQNDSDLLDLIKKVDIDTPQSIKDFQKMVNVSILYLKDVQRLKLPGSMCGIYLGDLKLVGGDESNKVNGAYNHFCDINPWLGIWYKDFYVIKDGTGKKINESAKDPMLMTICHELFHHFQSAYVLNSCFRDSKLLEATAAVLEHDFTDWLYNQNPPKLSFDPRSAEGDKILDFVDRSPKHWLLGSLCFPIAPSFANLDQLGELCKASLVAIARTSLLSGNQGVPLDSASLERAIRSQKGALDELSRSANLSLDQIGDIFGYIGEQIKGGPNCDAGYMLGDFIDYLRRHRMPSNRLHYILEYLSGGNTAEALKQGFCINTDEEFYEFYEGFIKQHLKEIVSSQYSFISNPSSQYKSFYYNQLLPCLKPTPQDCVFKLACWNHPGEYACRTVSFFGNARRDGNYNLFLVPSQKMKGSGEKAIKAAILKGDSLFAPTPYFLDVDSNGNCSPEYVALIFTHKFSQYVKDNYSGAHITGIPAFSEEYDYYDAVAFYAPRKKPIVKPTDTGGFRLTLNEDPPQTLVDNEYVTGVQFMLKDKRNGRYILSPGIKFADVSGMTTSVYLGFPEINESLSVSGHVRWVYQANDTTCYYSPWSEGEEAVSTTSIVDDDYNGPITTRGTIPPSRYR